MNIATDMARRNLSKNDQGNTKKKTFRVTVEDVQNGFTTVEEKKIVEDHIYKGLWKSEIRLTKVEAYVETKKLINIFKKYFMFEKILTDPIKNSFGKDKEDMNYINNLLNYIKNRLEKLLNEEEIPKTLLSQIKNYDRDRNEEEEGQLISLFETLKEFLKEDLTKFEQGIKKFKEIYESNEININNIDTKDRIFNDFHEIITSEKSTEDIIEMYKKEEKGEKEEKEEKGEKEEKEEKEEKGGKRRNTRRRNRKSKKTRKSRKNRSKSNRRSRR